MEIEKLHELARTYLIGLHNSGVANILGEHGVGMGDLAWRAFEILRDTEGVVLSNEEEPGQITGLDEAKVIFPDGTVLTTIELISGNTE